MPLILMTSPPMVLSMQAARTRALRSRYLRPGAIFFSIAALLLAYALMYILLRGNGPVLRGQGPAQAASAAVAVSSSFSDLSLLAKAVYVKDLSTGSVLYERNADAQLPLASLTKVPLAVAVSEVLSPDAAIKIPRDTAPKGSTERLGEGEVWQVKKVLDFTLVASSNAGAEILADAAAPAIRAQYPDAPADNATVWRMNEIAQALGMHNTYFLNPSGLDESATQSGAYGSARDIGTLFTYVASKWPSVFAGTTKDGLLLTSEGGDTTHAFNTDDALGDIPGLIMGKTGYTDLAGGNLAIVFDVGPAHPVVAVVLGSTIDGRFSDMKKIVSATFDQISHGDTPHL